MEKTPEEWEAELWARREKERAALREKVRQARHVSTKEPFDFDRFRQLYEAIAVPPHPTIPQGQAENMEESYYLDWEDVQTLQQAAEKIRGFIERGAI